MRKILIAGILVAVVPASIGLVTAVNGFSPGDETDESDNVCDVDGYGFGDGTCDGGGTGNCKGNCKQYGECNGICDGKCDGELIRNQYNKGNCWKNEILMVVVKEINLFSSSIYFLILLQSTS